MLNIFKKVKFLQKIEKVYKLSLFFPSTASFAMNNGNHEAQGANGNININNGVNNSQNNQLYNDIVEKINKKYGLHTDNQKYIFKEFLGKGGFGEVILVKRGRGEYVFKITKDTNRDREESVVLHRLKKGIIMSYGSIRFEENNNPEKNHLVSILEYCKYGNIIDFMKKPLKTNVMSETLVCYIAGQVVNGLKFMHSNGFAHFDLKPSNILVNEYLEFKLSDFSTTYKYNEKIKKFIPLGTGPFIAPEVFKESRITKYENFFKPDVFSLGVMCYKLFTGTYPYLKDRDNYLDSKGKIDFVKSTDENVINSQKLEHYEPSVVFKDFLLKCLEKKVKKRPDISDLENHPFIKQYKILLCEKEKLYNAGLFLSYLITDYFKAYKDECEKYELKKGKLILKNNNVENKDNEFGNKDLGQIIDDNFVPKKGKIEDVLTKDRKKKIFGIYKVNKKK